jgi:hypothetical protein
MNGLGRSHYNRADTDNGTRSHRAQQPDFACVHCRSFAPEPVTPQGINRMAVAEYSIASPVTAPGKAVPQTRPENASDLGRVYRVTTR